MRAINRLAKSPEVIRVRIGPGIRATTVPGADHRANPRISTAFGLPARPSGRAAPYRRLVPAASLRDRDATLT
jgi:hypothetical protein